MRWIIKVIANSVTGLLGRGERKARTIKIEGKRTEEAKGKAKRLKSERARKEAESRTGNKASE